MRGHFPVPRTLNRTGDLAFSVIAPGILNSFNIELFNASILSQFKTLLRYYNMTT